jgi:hypothetical protein
MPLEKNRSGTFVGIDPGEKGAVAVISNNADPLVYEGNVEVQLAALKATADIILVVVELPIVVPFQTPTATATQWRNFGNLEGFLRGRGDLPYLFVSPKTWQGAILPGRPAPVPAKGDKKISAKNRKALKAFCIESMRRRFPSIKVVSDGIADALALALYASSLG